MKEVKKKVLLTTTERDKHKEEERIININVNGVLLLLTGIIICKNGETQNKSFSEIKRHEIIKLQVTSCNYIRHQRISWTGIFLCSITAGVVEASNSELQNSAEKTALKRSKKKTKMRQSFKDDRLSLFIEKNYERKIHWQSSTRRLYE